MAFVARYEVGRTSVLGKSITGLGDREREIEMFSSWENRTLHLLTLQNPSGSSKLIVKVGITNPWIGMPPSTKGCVGLRIGAKGRFDDYRSAAVYGKGLDVGLTADGKT